MIGLVVVIALAVVTSDEDSSIPLQSDACGNTVLLDQVTTNCFRDSDGTAVPIGGVSPGATVVLEPMCGSGPTERCERVCRDWEGAVGNPYWVVIDGERSHTICRTWDRSEGEEDGEELTPAMVWNAFEELDWPVSELRVEPPGGRTLVNFETNFRTGNDEPHRQTVTLLGQQVEIEGRPESYVWHFGDETVRQTETPGAPYPDLLVTHQYRTKDTFHPRVDTVYVGRFRIDDGPWIEIPTSLTVEGEPQPLEVIGARPVLVAPDG